MTKGPFGDAHESMTKGVEPHHNRILEIDRQIAGLSQEKALIRISAVREIQAQLKLPIELIGDLVAGCR